jgi:hypothetical protein
LESTTTKTKDKKITKTRKKNKEEGGEWRRTPYLSILLPKGFSSQEEHSIYFPVSP